ncbi:MAG: glycosyltransferase family 2 protein [Cyanobacteria bacterium J06634_6]
MYALSLLLAMLLTVPTLVLAIETTAASYLKRSQTNTETFQKDISIAVLVPAHNEAQGIAPVLDGILGQLRAQDQLIVVADNCTDETAAIARAMGATVLERHNLHERGKGYALDFGLKALSENPPDAVVIMDADCQVQSGSLPQLAAWAVHTGAPTQAVYLFETPDSPTSKALISAFAIKVKNWVRPLGLSQLGLPSLLFGTGMAFPWHVLSSVNLASSHIVEDMKLSLDLAIAGYPALLSRFVVVTGKLPQAASAATSQRTRWEHGHLQVIKKYAPRLLWESIKQRRIGLLALSLELIVPPLSLLVLLWVVAFISVSIIGLIKAFWLPPLILGTAGGLLVYAIATAWFNFARNDLPLSRLLTAVGYVLWKIPLYFKFLVSPQSAWVRTERDNVGADIDPTKPLP